jgi:RimJ/RimL family protein N-acetyltransferase
LHHRAPDWWQIYYLSNEDHWISGHGGFAAPPHDGCVDIQLVIAPEARCHGADATALRQLVAHAFDSDTVHFVQIVVPESNVSACHLAAAQGFALCGTVPSWCSVPFVLWCMPSPKGRLRNGH